MSRVSAWSLRFVGVAGEDALVEALDRGERRAVAEHDVEEFELLDVAAHDDEAEGERGGQNEADRAPDPRPEDGGDHDRERRQPGGVAVDQRLDHLPGDELHHEVECCGPDDHGPAGVDGRSERHGEEGGADRADIGDEAQQAGQDAPEHRVGNADDQQADADDDGEGGVDAELGEEIAAEAAAAVIDGDRGAVEVVGAEQADEAVAQVLALEQGEDGDDEDDADRGERGEYRGEVGFGDLERGCAGGSRGGRGRRGWRARGRGAGGCGRAGGRGLGRVVADPVGKARDPADSVALDAGDLGFDGGGVFRQVRGEVGDLGADDGADGEDDAEGEHDAEDDGQHLAQVQPAQEADERRQHKGQQQRQGDGDKDLAAEVKRGHDGHEQEHDPRGIRTRRCGDCGGWWRLWGRLRVGHRGLRQRALQAVQRDGAAVVAASRAPAVTGSRRPERENASVAASGVCRLMSPRMR